MKLLPLFSSGLSYEVGDGHRIKFWDDIWCGERPLKEVFLEIYLMSEDPSSYVILNMSLQGGEVVWEPRLRRAAFD